MRWALRAKAMKAQKPVRFNQTCHLFLFRSKRKPLREKVTRNGCNVEGVRLRVRMLWKKSGNLNNFSFKTYRIKQKLFKLSQLFYRIFREEVPPATHGLPSAKQLLRGGPIFLAFPAATKSLHQLR